ncbi:putative glycolipid-binding domain-containing protein [Corallococcus sp. M34]|uniref:putative glycolipid-binding domain-containing protein n=1 Tax=Citreicoccus inhibens TaxID=2849499 RepID=UPI001C250A4B|nr:putative glycolipid-binding domain-containing protein [Citreicoccus inhibens]MBU8897258.1 putative glycolipid-binding domain-containing protein [Citreicoccus inhibens]
MLLSAEAAVSAKPCLHAWMWKRLDTPGSEYGELHEHPTGWDLLGSVVLWEQGTPCLVEYAVSCDRAWLTREVRIALARSGARQQLHLRVDARQCWWRGDEEVTQFRGCTDVDLGFTPATNTLPIRRLSLAVGQGEDVVAAWVRMPDLALVVLPQRYTRLAESRYRYESNGGRFVAELDVDARGLVTHYPPAWTLAGE